MNSKLLGVIVGFLLIIVAIILAVVQHYMVYNFYGDPSNKWYFYGVVGIIGIVGLVLAAWFYMKKSAT